MGQISQLSDDTLASILARLPLEEAIRTSILSSRWRHLRKRSTSLNFDSRKHLKDKGFVLPELLPKLNALEHLIVEITASRDTSLLNYATWWRLTCRNCISDDCNFSKQVTTYMNNGQTRLLRKLGPSIARRNEFSQKLSSIVPLKEQLYLRVMEEDTVIRIRNEKKWRHFLCLEGWRGDIGEMDEDSQEMIWSDGVLVHSGHIYPAAAVVTNMSWNQVVLQSATPVLVQFHGSGCVPCNEVRKVVDELAKDYKRQLKFFVLYADQDGEIAETYGVEAMPTTLVFMNGEARERVAGTTRKEYQVAIERVINEV